MSTSPVRGLAEWNRNSTSGRLARSLEHLRKALHADASDPTAHYRLALVYRKLGRNQDADRELAIFSQKQAAPK